MVTWVLDSAAALTSMFPSLCADAAQDGGVRVGLLRGRWRSLGVGDQEGFSALGTLFLSWSFLGVGAGKAG